MRSLVVAVVLVALASPALAQAPGATPPGSWTDEERSHGIALGLSLGVTTLGFGLVRSDNKGVALVGAAALMLGPTIAQWYAGNVGVIGLAGRVAGAALLVKGIVAADTGGCEAWYSDAECDQVHRDERRAGPMIYGGMALLLGATVYDVIDSYRGVSRWNRDHALHVTPTALGPRATGVAVSLRF